MLARLTAFTAALLISLPAFAGDVTVTDAWARATIGQLKNSAAYMTLKNVGKADDRLLSAASPAAARVEVHENIIENGIAKMRPVDALAVPAGASAELKPGGHHIMIMGLKAPLADGGTLPLTLTFEKAGRIEVQVPVSKGMPGAHMDHDKMDHGSGHKH